ncbi:MAG: LysM peptidoglycan-binding domain-containing protein [Chloroflexi bacterium]|nr:LysM peptidoglycan-binding domain-containing protein [Chloroflexota bacterium]
MNPDIIPPMNPKRFFTLFILSILLLFGLWLPANAAPSLQVQYSTPTPGPDGRIIYIVQPGDTCTRVTLLNGISEQTLRQLNSKLDSDCTLVEGQQLLIGLAGPAAGTATVGPSPTPLLPTVSPTPFTGTTEICVLLFDDQNGDALRQETEPAVAGGAVSVTEINGEYSAARDTVINPDPEAYQGICFSDVPEGSYNITVGIPDNFNPTMELNYKLDVHAGDRAFVDFGAQSQEISVAGNEETPGNGGMSPIMGILGGLLLLGGAALGYYAWRSGKPESKLSGGNILKR